MSVTGVHYDKVPMTPTFGQQPRLIVTIQPAGALFDPPARLTLPNVDGLAPGQVTEMYSFDHDLGTFVSIGPATTSEDATVVVADPGVGILKAGWHSGGPPVPSGTPHDCPECQIAAGGACVPDPEELECDDQDDCTINDRCQGGECKGDDIFIEEVVASADGEDFLLTAVREEVQFSVDLNTNCPNPEFEWNFDDDQTSTEQTPTHEYELVGRFKPKVTVTCPPCEAVGGEDEVNVHAATPDVTIVAWVNEAPIDVDGMRGSANPLLLAGLFTSPISCNFQLGEWAAGVRTNITSDADRVFANAFLLNYSANQPPPPVIDPGAYVLTEDYRLINRIKALYDAEAGVIQNVEYLETEPSRAGPTSNPCGGLFGFLETSPSQQHPLSPALGDGSRVFQLVEGRIGTTGQRIDRTLNDCSSLFCLNRPVGPTTPWIWSVIRFDANGQPIPETQNFPSYSIYEDGELQEVIPQSDPESFISLDSVDSEKLPGEIQ